MIKAETEARITSRTVAEVEAQRKAARTTDAWLRQQGDGLGHDLSRYTGPLFGTSEWLALPSDDPARAAALLLAARAWLHKRLSLAEDVLVDSAYLGRLGGLYAETAVADANEHARVLAAEVRRLPTYAQLAARRHTYPPIREVRATEDWTPVAIPGRPGWYRHWQSGGGQLDAQSYDLEPGGTA